MYLIDADVALLCAMLDEDPEIALIRADGPGRWKAQPHVPALEDGPHALWHIPSGPIELESKEVKDKPKVIKDPFRGWAARVPEFERGGAPWFGPGPLGIIFLTVRRTAGPASRIFRPMTERPWSAPANDVIGLSTFNWIGNEYRDVGHAASEETQRWWNALRRRIAKRAIQIPRDGRWTGADKDVWAFPAALEQIKAGRRRADNA
jgi:hypothetical protein